LPIAYGGGYNKRGYPYRYFQNTPRCTAAVRWRQAGRVRVGGRWAAVCRIGGGPHAPPYRRTAPRHCRIGGGPRTASARATPAHSPAPSHRRRGAPAHGHKPHSRRRSAPIPRAPAHVTKKGR
jgi:hypothetical protein